MSVMNLWQGLIMASVIFILRPSFNAKNIPTAVIVIALVGMVLVLEYVKDIMGILAVVFLIMINSVVVILADPLEKVRDPAVITAAFRSDFQAVFYNLFFKT